MTRNLLIKTLYEFRTIKDTHREKVPSNKTPALTESMNMDIWVVGTLNQLFIGSSQTETKFQKHKVVTDKTPFFVIGPFCTHHSICFKGTLMQI